MEVWGVCHWSLKSSSSQVTKKYGCQTTDSLIELTAIIRHWKLEQLLSCYTCILHVRVILPVCQSNPIYFTYSYYYLRIRLLCIFVPFSSGKVTYLWIHLKFIRNIGYKLTLSVDSWNTADGKSASEGFLVSNCCMSYLSDIFENNNLYMFLFGLFGKLYTCIQQIALPVTIDIGNIKHPKNCSSAIS